MKYVYKKLEGNDLDSLVEKANELGDLGYRLLTTNPLSGIKDNQPYYIFLMEYAEQTKPTITINNISNGLSREVFKPDELPVLGGKLPTMQL